MQNFKLSVIGCSVAIKMRPPAEYPENKNYGVLLEEKLIETLPDKNIIVNNFGFSRATILEIYEKLESFLVSYPDVFVLNIGVPDASTREIPYWYAQILNTRKKSVVKFLFSFVHYYLFKKFRAFFVKLRGKRSWISLRRFSKYYSKILSELNKDSNAKVVTMSINLGNDRVEKQIPGSRKNYKKYNSEIESLSKKFGAFYVNFDDLESSVYFPDGIHYSKNGHNVVAERIFEILQKNILANDK